MNTYQHHNLEKSSPWIIWRNSVTQSLPTGTQIIDNLFPLGKGQRQLFIGDNSTGKTSLATTMILNQKNFNYNYSVNGSGWNRLFVIYASIGAKKSEVAQIWRTLKYNNAFWYTTIVYANSSDSCALQYIVPSVASTIGEFFRDQGLNSLVILDDLSKHAVAYQQLSLLIKKAPSRKAYPGDIFYLHAKLLERAAQMSKKFGYGTMSMIPIVETQQENFSAYIPTNIISITDGQIYLSRNLYRKGLIPAVNMFKSVSRVGSKAQPRILTITGWDIRNIFFNFFNVEETIKSGQQLNSGQLKQYKMGLAALGGWYQDEHSPRAPEVQVIVNILLTLGLLCPNNPKASLNFLLERFYKNIPWIFHYITKLLNNRNVDKKSINFIIASIIFCLKNYAKI